MTFVRVGSITLNLDQVTQIRDAGGDVEILFVGAEKPAVLRGPDAERLRQWLDRNAEGLGLAPEPGSDPR